jgi:hypothetical protein
MDKTYPSDFGCLPGWGVAGNAQKFQTEYDNLASGGGGRIHFPERYYFTSPLHLHSNKVVITGNGPQTGFWFQLDDPTKDAFVVEPNNPSDPGSFLQGVEMRDFSVLGGANCAYNLVRIRYVVRSRFKGIHAMGGTNSHPFAIGTGWCNQFELVATFATDQDGLPSPIYRPSTWGQALARPKSDYVHLLPSDEHRGGLNANHFWLLVEGYGYPQGQNPDTYNLVRISNQNGPQTVNGQSAGNWTDQGNNWITGTIEAKHRRLRPLRGGVRLDVPAPAVSGRVQGNRAGELPTAGGFAGALVQQAGAGRVPAPGGHPERGRRTGDHGDHLARGDRPSDRGAGHGNGGQQQSQHGHHRARASERHADVAGRRNLHEHRHRAALSGPDRDRGLGRLRLYGHHGARRLEEDHALTYDNSRLQTGRRSRGAPLFFAEAAW